MLTIGKISKTCLKSVLSNNKVNVEKYVSIGAVQVTPLYNSLPGGFYGKLPKKLVTMNLMRNSVSVEVVNRNLRCTIV